MNILSICTEEETFTLNTRILHHHQGVTIYCSTSRTKTCSSSHWRFTLCVIYKFYSGS